MPDDFDPGSFYRHLENSANERKAQWSEFLRLCAEPPLRLPMVGERVVVAAGFIGRGHLWIRTEAIVTEVGDISVKVRATSDTIIPGWEDWVHPALITDILPGK